MWRSGKKPTQTRKSTLPPSQRTLLWAKDDRAASKTQFHFLEKEWTSKKRSMAPVPEEPVAAVNPKAPAWMAYRKKPPAPPMYFRTKAVTKSPPKKPV
jgi:hypothetical protein